MKSVGFRQLYSGGKEDTAGTFHGDFRESGGDEGGLPGEQRNPVIFPAQGAAFGCGGQELHFAGREGKGAVEIKSGEPEVGIVNQQGATAAGQILRLFRADGKGIDV